MQTWAGSGSVSVQMWAGVSSVSVQEYASLAPQPETVSDVATAARAVEASWPTDGEVVFDAVCLRCVRH